MSEVISEFDDFDGDGGEGVEGNFDSSELAGVNFTPTNDFFEKKELTVADFYRSHFARFALHRAKQRIPRIDGLAETQRKVIWALMKHGSTKTKTPITTIYALLLSETAYEHGDASAYLVASNLVAPYKNNLRFFTPDGNFGDRYMQVAGQPRYIKCKNTPLLDVFFKEEDIIATFSERKSNNLPVEPLTLYPLLPLAIINGQYQTAIGFATHLLPRKVETILELFIGILSGQVTSLPNYLEPSWPYYYGPIEMVAPNCWETRGVVRKEKIGRKEVIRIVEVPPTWDKYKLIEVLTKHVNSGLIQSEPLNDSMANTFDVTIVAPNLMHLSEEEIVRKLELTSKITESFVFYTSDDKFEVTFNTISQYINYFIQERIKIYAYRKRYLLEEKLFQLQKSVSLINYINEVVEGRIEIRNVSEEDIINKLKTYPAEYNFTPNTKTFKYLPPELKAVLDSEKSYDYLFDFSVRNFTPQYREKLKEKYQAIYNEYVTIQNTSEAQLWLNDLLEFKAIFNKTHKE